MNIAHRRWLVSTLGLLSLLGLSACLVGRGGGYVGGVYEPSGYEYGGWGSGYHVAPPRDGDRRREQSTSHVYRPAPPDRRTPKIPTRPRDHHNP
jgi:hypothetical protein